MQLARACISSELTCTKNGSNRQLPADGQDLGHEQEREIHGEGFCSLLQNAGCHFDVLVIELNEFFPSFLLICILTTMSVDLVPYSIRCWALA